MVREGGERGLEHRSLIMDIGSWLGLKVQEQGFDSRVREHDSVFLVQLPSSCAYTDDGARAIESALGPQ